MDIFDIREKVLLGLRNVTLLNGETLSSILEEHQIRDIANTITHFVPKGIQYNMANIQSEILSNIPNGSTIERLHGKERTPVLPSDTVKDLKHKLFIILYTLFLHGEDIDKSIDDMFAFYRSLVIDEFDLSEEVAHSDIQLARAVKINETEYVRIATSNGVLVPTQQTKEKFKELL